MGTRTPHPILMNTVGECNSLIVRGRPFRTCFFLNHIIINMGIDGDMIEKLPNNPPHFGRPWRTSVRMVGEVTELNGLE